MEQYTHTDKSVIAEQVAYHINFTPKEIAGLKIKDVLQPNVYSRTNGNPAIKKRLEELWEAHIQHLHPAESLFEVQGKPMEADKIRNRVYKLLMYYQLEEIYKQQLVNALDENELAPHTKKLYTGMFLYFLKSFHYNHPMEITNDEIKKVLLLTGQKSESHQNSVINALKFCYKAI